MDNKNLQLMASPENTAKIIIRNPGSTIAEISRHEDLDASVLAEVITTALKHGLIRKGTPRICAVNYRNSITWWPAQ